MDKRYARVVKAARMTMLPGAEQTKYLRAMISESEKKDLIEGGFEYGFEQGIEQGIAQGVAQGVAQSKAEIAKAMLSEGLKASVVSKCTGLSREELAAL
jgi:predicted transposase/invertase (TIGR01784 family)